MNFLTYLVLKFRMDILFWTLQWVISYYTSTLLRLPIGDVVSCPAFPHRSFNPPHSSTRNVSPASCWPGGGGRVTSSGNQSLSIMQCNIDWNISIAIYILSFDNSPLCRPTEQTFWSQTIILRVSLWTDISRGILERSSWFLLIFLCAGIAYYSFQYLLTRSGRFTERYVYDKTTIDVRRGIMLFWRKKISYKRLK
jgi:hypothetical protein